MAAQKTIAAIVLAGGRGMRVNAGEGTTPKQYRPINGVPVLKRALDAFLTHPEVTWVLPVIGKDHETYFADLKMTHARLLPPIHGGYDRGSSSFAGLRQLRDLSPNLVLIHDGARPFVEPALISQIISGLDHHDGMIPALPLSDTVKRRSWDFRIEETFDREMFWTAQTPQGFHYDQLLRAYEQAISDNWRSTDDSGVAERAGLNVGFIQGEYRNIKITYPEDFSRADIMAGAAGMDTRVGTGFDVHEFEPGDGVMLGGVLIAHTAKLKGHSDADVALHALCDAIYGAVGEGDIGTHFPPSDPQWKGADSGTFLQDAVWQVVRRGGRIVNIDITIVCEAPRISPHVAEMKAGIAFWCRVLQSQVAIKATTSEGLGFTGRREGIMAMATATVQLPREV